VNCTAHTICSGVIKNFTSTLHYICQGKKPSENEKCKNYPSIFCLTCMFVKGFFLYIVKNCSALQYIAVHCIEMHCNDKQCIVMRMHCIAVHCIAMHCIDIQRDSFGPSLFYVQCNEMQSSSFWSIYYFSDILSKAAKNAKHNM
jgi:hypothetical protein